MKHRVGLVVCYSRQGRGVAGSIPALAKNGVYVAGYDSGARVRIFGVHRIFELTCSQIRGETNDIFVCDAI